MLIRRVAEVTDAHAGIDDRSNWVTPRRSLVDSERMCM